MENKYEEEIKQRTEFLEGWGKWDEWLKSLGFRSPTLDEGMDMITNHYDHYDEFIKELYGVEQYVHDTLRYELFFIRGFDEYKIMFVGDMGTHSEVMSVEEAMKHVTERIKSIRDNILKGLEPVMNL